MAGKKHGLGRGLDALIPQNRSVSTKEQEKSVPAAAKNQEATEIVEENKSGDHAAAGKIEKGIDAKESSAFTDASKNSTAEKNDSLKESQESDKQDGMIMVRITKVEPDRSQPRKNFSEEGLKQLADSIKKYGILEPLLVERKGDYYEIVAGERRWRAAKLAGLKEVPVVIADYDERTKAEVQLIENVQREDINPIEEARAYKRLIEEYALKQEEVAEAVSKSRAAIANSMRLLKLAEKVQEMLADPDSGLTTGHARALISIEDEDIQIEIAEKVIKENLSVRDTERLVKNLGKKKNTATKEKDESLEAIYRDLENKLKLALGTKASIVSKGKKGGRLEIEFYDADTLDKILEKLL